MMFSKMVNDRYDSAMVVIQAARTHADMVAARLLEIMAPALPGEGSENMAGVIQRFGRTLQASVDKLVAADEAHEAEKADDVAVRVELEESIEGVYREIVDFRTGLEAVGQSDAVLHIGLTGTTPRDPTELMRIGRVIQGQLPGLTNLVPVRRGLVFDAMSYAEPMTLALTRLDDAREAVRREQREFEVTLLAKNEALAAYDACFMSVARALESLFRLAGLGWLADRVRPSSRRPGTIDELPQAPSVPGAEIPGTPGTETPPATV